MQLTTTTKTAKEKSLFCCSQKRRRWRHLYSGELPMSKRLPKWAKGLTQAYVVNSHWSSTRNQYYLDLTLTFLPSHHAETCTRRNDKFHWNTKRNKKREARDKKTRSLNERNIWPFTRTCTYRQAGHASSKFLVGSSSLNEIIWGDHRMQVERREYWQGRINTLLLQALGAKSFLARFFRIRRRRRLAEAHSTRPQKQLRLNRYALKRHH